MIVGPLDEQDEDITILGFFSIAISSVQMKKEVARSIRDALGVHSKDMIISSFLIGQLAKNDSCPDKLRGADLLEYAINLILNAHDIAGGRFVRVDSAMMRDWYHSTPRTDFGKSWPAKDSFIWLDFSIGEI